MKENSDTNCFVNVKNFEISNELGKHVPEFAQNSESESVTGRFKRISSKVDFNIVTGPNILLGLTNYGKMFASSTVIQVLYFLPVFRDFINKLLPLVNGAAVKIRKLLSEIDTSSEPVRAFNYVSYLGLQHY